MTTCMRRLRIMVIISEKGLKFCEGLKLFMYKSTPTDLIPGDAGEWPREVNHGTPDEAAFKMMEKTEGGKETVHKREV